jgi:hypothetical protein
MGVVPFVGPFDGESPRVSAGFGLEHAACLLFGSPFSSALVLPPLLLDDAVIQLERRELLCFAISWCPVSRPVGCCPAETKARLEIVNLNPGDCCGIRSQPYQIGRNACLPSLRLLAIAEFLFALTVNTEIFLDLSEGLIRGRF